MHTPNVTAVLDAEKTRLEALLASVAPPTKYEQYSITKTLAAVSRMRQGSAESDTDYVLRLNLEAQTAIAGHWSTSFFAQLDASLAADTAIGSRGGRGRSE